MTHLGFPLLKSARLTLVTAVSLLTLFINTCWPAVRVWAQSASSPTCDAKKVQCLSQIDLNAIDGPWENYVIGGGSGGSCGTTTTLVGSDNEQKAFNFFVGKGLTAAQSAGIVGNLMAESGVNPNNSQDGQKDPTPINGIGFGIGQWTYSDRQQPLVALAQKEGKPVIDLGVQLDYVWQELNTNSAQTLTDLKAITGSDNAAADAAAGVVMNDYERPAERVLNLQIRSKNAEQVLAQYGGTGTNSGSTTSTGSTCAIACDTSSSSATTSSSVRQNVVCLAQQELATWKSQPGYPWNGENPYSENAYLKYSDNSPEEWCADFASWVYNQAGDPFTGGTSGGWRLPAVSEIQALGEQGQDFQWHPASSNYTPQPGDLAIHGGDHVNIFISSTGGLSTYIGGDQGNGPYPGGSIVSADQESGYYSAGITGYVSPTK